MTQTSRFDTKLAKKVVTKYYDLKVVNGGKEEPTEYVFVRGVEEKAGKQLAVIKIYLADPVKRQIGLEEFLVATLYVAGEEKDNKLPLISTRGLVRGEKPGSKVEKVNYVLMTSGGVAILLEKV